MTSPDPFLPSGQGFPFTNSWPSQPAVVLRTPFGPVNIGNAAAGLCGGMVFAALDYWHAGTPPPPRQPAPADPLYGDLGRRTISEQWPRIAADLDRGIPVPLGLVTVASS